MDTCVLIYSLDENPKYLALAAQVLAWVERSGHTAVTSTVTMTEILVESYRTLPEADVRRLQDLLLTYPNLEWIPPDLEIASLGAQFRASHKLKTIDALLAATAVLTGATVFVTNDPIFKRITAFETLIFDDLL